jgi:hypothetical protein
MKISKYIISIEIKYMKYLTTLISTVTTFSANLTPKINNSKKINIYTFYLIE